MASACWPSPAAEAARAPPRRGARLPSGERARLTGGLPVDEVFTTTTGAPQGGGRAMWGDEILTPNGGSMVRGVGVASAAVFRR
jgi:hypothetical protein